MTQHYLIPDWPAPARVRAVQTTRQHLAGGSRGPYVAFNVAQHVGDQLQQVNVNRQHLRQSPILFPDGETRVLPEEPFWLNQVHGTQVLDAGDCNRYADVRALTPPNADASYTHQTGKVCAVLTADCLPLLLCAADGSAVAAVHAGWRGLAEGVIEATVRALAIAPSQLLVWLGPAIGPQAFEVGEDVRAIFCAYDPQAVSAFTAQGQGKWRCDLYALARQRLQYEGVSRVFGGGLCTYRDPQRFYSFRRDGITGRMASLIWIEAEMDDR